MSETVNAVINNVFDRIGEVVQVVEPIIKSVGTISQTVVQETAYTGFVHTVIGFGCCCLAVVFVVVLIFSEKYVKTKEVRETIEWGAILCTILFVLVGPCLILCNLRYWLAPTREIILMTIDKIV